MVGGSKKTKPIQACPFVKPLRGKLRAGSEQRRMEPNASLRQAIPKACGFEAATQAANKEYDLKNKANLPAFGRKSEALNPKLVLSEVDGSETR